MEILRRRGTLGLLLLVTACDPSRPPTDIDPGDEQIVVSSVLDAGSDTVFVSLLRVTPRLHSREASVRQITGADVRIEGEGAALRLEEAQPGFPPCVDHYSFSSELEVVSVPCYAAVLPGGVRAGGRYRLRISLLGGGTIEGAAVVPRPPEILAPEENSRWARHSAQNLDTLKLRWSASPGTAGIGFSLQATAVFREGSHVPNAVCTIYLIGAIRPSVHAVGNTPRQDSTALRYDLISCTGHPGTATSFPFRPDSLYARLVVTAYDTAYTRYAEARLRGTLRREEAAAGITGSLGVFAGVASAERQVTLVPEP